MKTFLFTLLACFLLVNCSNSKKSANKITQFIPESASVVLNINDFETFKSDLKNNAFIDKLSNTSLNKNLNTTLDKLKLLSTKNKVLICFNSMANESNFTIITKYSDSLFGNHKLDSIRLYGKTMDSIFIGSPSDSIIKNISLNKGSSFDALEQISHQNASFSIYLNKEKTQALGNSLLNKNVYSFTNWMLLDVHVAPDQISFNGLSIPKDTTQHLLDVFKNTIPQENTIQRIVPSKSDGFSSFTYNDFLTFQHNIASYNQQTIDSLTTNELFETTNEIGELSMNDESAIVLKSLDAFSTKEALRDYQNIISNFRNIDILEFDNTSFLKDTFSPLISTNQASKYINIDDFFVFAKSEDLLKTIITDYQNGTTLSNDKAFKDIAQELSDESSLLIVTSPTKLKQILEGTLNEELNGVNLRNYKSSAIQFVQDDGVVHVNAIIKKNTSRAQQNTISEVFNLTLDSDLLTNPQFVINHRTNGKDIVVQDINNHLYLISKSGKVLWKKKLPGEILGEIQQVDLYKNGRLQLAFATSSRVYIIDRNGQNVAPFPLSFNDKITQPLSIFDYDNKKNYRFLITQGNSILMYDKVGIAVSGFRYNNSSNAISSQPKHFRINSKDYIVFAAGKRMMILNRQGRTRIRAKEIINFSKNSIFKYNNKFTTTNSKGELVQVNLKGNVSKQSLNLPVNHDLSTTDKTLVTLAENKLTIKLKSIELDFGNYTKPKIFYLNDKIYVTLTDLQTQKVYLFDSQAKAIKNFPVYGNTTIDLGNIDNDSNLEFVTKGESNSIIVYQKN